VGLIVLGLPGCVVVRVADYAAPGLRLDRAGNPALPARDAPEVEAAFAAHAQADAAQRRRKPTPYHWYVDSPAPGTFEGDHVVGLAFSGGGSRGIYFSAACVKELEALGPIVVETEAGERQIDLLAETDYVSGVSTGAVTAALFALNQGDKVPEAYRLEHWPDAFNINPIAHGARHLAVRPDWLVRDFVLDMNTRPAFGGTLAALYFGGNPFDLRSGLRFADLPQRPVLLMGATVIHDPGPLMLHTRLPYRFTLDEHGPLPWSVGVQSFESFRTDPMRYSLGEAYYNSLSFPGHARSGLMAVREDPDWVFQGLPPETAARMARARTQYGYVGTYELKDGGLIDNRGFDIIGRIFAHITTNDPPRRQPLLIGLDADFAEVRPPEPGAGVLRKGWFRELQDTARASWQAGQNARLRLSTVRAEEDGYALVHFRYTAWLHHLPEVVGGSDTPETQHLLALCAEEPLIGTPERMLEVAREVGAAYTALSDDATAMIRIAARFAVWLERDRLLEWAEAQHGGVARFGAEHTEKDD